LNPSHKPLRGQAGPRRPGCIGDPMAAQSSLAHSTCMLKSLLGPRGTVYAMPAQRDCLYPRL